MCLLRNCSSGQAGFIIGCLLTIFCGANTWASEPVAEIVFQRSVRPLLAKHCFKCHGPDEETREAGLRLDSFVGATTDLGGYRAIEPGDPEASELIARIEHADPELRMPPGGDGSELSREEVEVLRDWIRTGGQYKVHWAFVPPRRSTPSDHGMAQSESERDWSRDPVDDWILGRLTEVGLPPNPVAPPRTLLRRLYLDVTGLPPEPEQVDRFVADTHPMAYAKQVDRLLADPATGERWARVWLDLARYADTNGYEKDRPRTIWPYRDWVIRALASDMPFDQFSIEQIAGDMMADRDHGAVIATGFHRNTMLNEEGGIDPLEYRYLAMVDRVATVGTIWLGMTVGCAQCHTHKYDPITHEDYFRMMALLNNADEPELSLPDRSREAARQLHEQQVEDLIHALVAKFPPLEESDKPRVDGTKHFQHAFKSWLGQLRHGRPRWVIPEPIRFESTLPKLRWQEDGSLFADGDATKRDEYRLVYSGESLTEPVNVLRLEVLPDPRLPAGGPGRSFYEGRRGDFFLSELELRVDGRKWNLERPSHSYGNLSVGSGGVAPANVIDGDGSTGWSTSDRPGQPHQWLVHLSEPLPPGVSWEVNLLFERHFAASLGRFRISVGAAESADLKATVVPADLERELKLVPGDEDIPAALRDRLLAFFVRETPVLDQQRGPLEKLLSSRPELLTTMVMREREADNPRATYLHHRGEYLQVRERVQPGIPELFRGMIREDSQHSGEDGPSDRLEFARWLVSRENPLVARVTMNRLWRELFGRGLVRTAGDFGTQSQPPEYPQVLDRLAVDMIDEGWSLQRGIRRLVHTAVYRQSSDIREDHRRLDPENILLARSDRFRLSAEAIRDSALVASGELSREIGGPSVRPPQDPAVTRMAWGAPGWESSTGSARYRRSLYTFAKRTAPFAAYQVFDGPTGENCLPRRDRSNTPLQALTLLNDPMFVELAEALSRDVLRRFEDPAVVATEIFRRVLAREPSEGELRSTLDFVEQISGELNSRDSEHAITVWKWVARGVMNTDEALNRQ